MLTDELQELLNLLEKEIEKRKNLPNIQEKIDAMHELLFEAAKELAPIQISTLRHIASLKLRKDGVCDCYEVTNKQIRDIFEKYGQSNLLPKVKSVK